jgi:ankyrin repeat protein
LFSFLMVGADLNAKSVDGESVFSLAVRTKKTVLCRDLLTKNADISWTNADNWTLLHIATEVNFVEIFEVDPTSTGWLMEMSVKPTTSTLEVPLHMAVRIGHVDFAKRLIRLGTCISTLRDLNGNSVLDLAVQFGYVDLAQMLLERNWNVNEPHQLSGDTCLHTAVRHNRLEMVQFLLGWGAVKTILNTNRQSPLQLAEELGLVELKQLLVDTLPNGDMEMEVVVNWNELNLQNRKPCLASSNLDGQLQLQFAIHRFFTFPVDYDQRAGIKRQDLANNGFFFVHDYKSLQCYFCSYEIKSLQGWKGAQYLEMNRLHIERSQEAFGSVFTFLHSFDHTHFFYRGSIELFTCYPFFKHPNIKMMYF